MIAENRNINNTVNSYDAGYYNMEQKEFIGGLAVYVINENETNNDDVNNKLVDVIEVDGTTTNGLDTSSGNLGKNTNLYNENDATPNYTGINFQLNNISLKNDGSNTFL